MTRLQWGAAGGRKFQTGVDRGVLYVPGHDGVVWNGLTSVEESSSGGDTQSFYYDGYNYLNLSSLEEFRATVTALYSPPEFDECDGTVAIATGIFASQQRRKPFGFSYRTKIGNDLDSSDYGYKLHLVYNALATPSTRTNNTLSSDPEALPLSWQLVTKPVRISGAAPSAHITIDSTGTDAYVLSLIEDILYGNASSAPRMPTVEELISISTTQNYTYGSGPYGQTPYGGVA